MLCEYYESNYELFIPKFAYNILKLQQLSGEQPPSITRIRIKRRSKQLVQS